VTFCSLKHVYASNKRVLLLLVALTLISSHISSQDDVLTAALRLYTRKKRKKKYVIEKIQLDGAQNSDRGGLGHRRCSGVGDVGDEGDAGDEGDQSLFDQSEEGKNE